jgi:dihydrolipoamide dehydrogenase
MGEVGLDLGVMMGRKEKIVQTMSKGIEALLKGHDVAYFAGKGKVVGGGKVAVEGDGGEQVLAAENILLATGSAPADLKNLPFDGERIISSTEALALEEVPERLVVIGGGAIGLEMGSVWSRLGAEVLVVEFMDQILPGMDREMAQQLQRLLKRQGVDCKLQTSAQQAEVKGDKVTLTIAEGDQQRVEECDRVLVAVGRRPYSQGLGLEEVGVEVNERGQVVVDGHFRTNVEGIWAIGDLIPGPMLAHKAEEEGVAAVERMAGKAGQVNYDAIPAVVYTHPELASVGMSEEAAVEKGHEVRVGKYQFRANARAHCMDEIDGLVKIVADADTDRLLGMHILGPQASHLIAEGVLAVEFAASAEDVARTVHAHPALSEVIKEAAWATME